MKHHGRYAVIALCILLSVLGSHPLAAQEPIRIGGQLPLSGERLAVGLTMKQGLDMAIEALNRQGGVNGVPLAVVYEDDHNTKEGAVEAVRRLIQDHRVVAIIGELFSGFVMASREFVEQAGVPYLTGATSPQVTAGAKWIFRVGASDTLRAEIFARYAAEHHKVQRVALLHDRTGIHNARADRIAEVLQKKYNIAPVFRGTWKPGDQDFSPLLAEVKKSPVQAIIALGEGAEGGPLLRQVRALGIPATLIAQRDFAGTRVLEVAGEAAEGVLIITEYLPALQGPERQAWARTYHERTGAEANIIAAQYYDAVLLLAEAIKKGGQGREEIRAALQQVKGFRGVMADYTFDPQHNGVHRFLAVRIHEGKPTLLEVLDEP